MVELGLASFYTPEQMCLQAFCELGRALDSQKTNRADEALIVYDHALRRTEGLDELMHDRGRVLSGMATYYLRKKDDAKYKLYNKMSQECEKFGLTDAMKDFMDKSQASLENMFKGEVETDPEKILANLDTDLQLSSRGMMGETIPGLGEVFANLTAGLDETKKTSRLVLEAAVAKKNGDLDEATKKYTEALNRSEKLNRISGPSQRISILCSLAEIKQKQGDEPAAESLLKGALAAAEEYVEATPSLGKSSLWNALVSYADFLKNAGRFEEAEQNYQRALTVHEECTDSFLERHGCQRSDFSGTLAHIKERYAQLLRVTKRDSEAEKIEAEAVGHKQEAEDRQTEIKARRERLNPEQ
jgi:tetratricopeptide (TPR) repeat protein